MKKLLLFLVVGMIAVTTHAQINAGISPEAVQCLNELKPIVEKAKTAKENGNIIQYVSYLSKACNVIDKHLNSINNIDERLDLMWAKVDLLPNILYDSDGTNMSQRDYNQFSSMKIQTLESMLRLSNSIHDPTDQAIVSYDIYYELAEVYFELEKYAEARRYYSMCISKFNTVRTIPNIQDQIDIDVMGQKAYYKMGYVAYKLNDRSLAGDYYNKAKTLLNDDFIQPYR